MFCISTQNVEDRLYWWDGISLSYDRKKERKRYVSRMLHVTHRDVVGVGWKLEWKSLMDWEDTHVCFHWLNGNYVPAHTYTHTSTQLQCWHLACQRLMRLDLSPVQSPPLLPVPAWCDDSLHSSMRCVSAYLQSDHWQDGDHSCPSVCQRVRVCVYCKNIISFLLSTGINIKNSQKHNFIVQTKQNQRFVSTHIKHVRKQFFIFHSWVQEFFSSTERKLDDTLELLNTTFKSHWDF